MKGFCPIISRITVILTGLIWGAISFFWLGYSVLTLGNLIEEPGSLDYEYEGDAMRIYGLIGLILYAMLFAVVLLFLSRKKRNLFIFLSSMILSGIILGIYIFALRG